jgi:MFS family permease
MQIFPSLSEIALLFSARLVVTAAIGCAAGFILKDKIANPYLTSIIALFYLYDIATFLTFLYLGYIISTLLLALASIGLFRVANKLVSTYTSHKKRVIVFAVIGFVVSYIICASSGLYLMRFISSYFLH